MTLKKILNLISYEEEVALYGFETETEIFNGKMKHIPHIYVDSKVYQLETDVNNKIALTIEEV